MCTGAKDEKMREEKKGDVTAQRRVHAPGCKKRRDERGDRPGSPPDFRAFSSAPILQMLPLRGNSRYPGVDKLRPAADVRFVLEILGKCATV